MYLSQSCMVFFLFLRCEYSGDVWVRLIWCVAGNFQQFDQLTQHEIVHMVIWQDQLWTQNSCWAPLSTAGCQIFTTLAANSTPIKSEQTSLRESHRVSKVALDLSRGVSLCFCGTESKLSWRAVVGSLWSVHHEHERTHLPFCSFVYR